MSSASVSGDPDALRLVEIVAEVIGMALDEIRQKSRNDAEFRIVFLIFAATVANIGSEVTTMSGIDEGSLRKLGEIGNRISKDFLSQ